MLRSFQITLKFGYAPVAFFILFLISTEQSLSQVSVLPRQIIVLVFIEWDSCCRQWLHSCSKVISVQLVALNFRLSEIRWKKSSPCWNFVKKCKI